MPELPEVETIVADLRPQLVGRTITRCELSFPTIVRHPEPEEFIDAVVDHRIESVGRRGKYILIGLRPSGPAPLSAAPTPPHGREGKGHLPMNGEDILLLVVHLGMTGQVRIV